MVKSMIYEMCWDRYGNRKQSMKNSNGLESVQDDKGGKCYLYIVHRCAVTSISSVCYGTYSI